MMSRERTVDEDHVATEHTTKSRKNFLVDILANLVLPVCFAWLIGAGMLLWNQLSRGGKPFASASFLAFHNVLESSSTIFCVAVFLIGWYSFRKTRSVRILAVSCAFLAIGAFDMLHMLSFQDMPDFLSHSGTEKGIFFWVAARIIQAATILYYVTSEERKTASRSAQAVGLGLVAGTVAIIAAAVIGWQESLPHLFIPGIGLTRTKILLEYAVVALTLATMLLLVYRLRRKSTLEDRQILVASVFFVASELMFTEYSNAFDIFNLLGHLFKAISICFIFNVLFISLIRRPYRQLETALHSLDRVNAKLEARVAARTRDLEASFKRLKEERDRSELLLMSIGDGVIAIDRSWKIRLLNPSAEELIGVKQADVKGQPLLSVIRFIRTHDRTENIRFIEEAMLHGKIRSMENSTLLIRPDGSEMPVGDSASPIYDNGEITGAIIIFRDMTREAETSMVKSDFAYASHQFRTPVTKMAWSLENALAARGERSIKAGIVEAQAALQSVSRLAEELITISELEQRMVIPKLLKTDLRRLAEETIERLKPQAQAHEVSLHNAIDVELSGVTDPSILGPVLADIVENAINFSAPGKEVWIESSADGKIELRVRDQGIGIPENEWPLVFNKFFRGSNFDTAAVPGAGLGLHICRERLKLLGGKIWFNTREGEGSTFFISLNRQPSDVTSLPKEKVRRDKKQVRA